MLCGATQHSNTDPHDRTSPAIPIGPHWIIKRYGKPGAKRERAEIGDADVVCEPLFRLIGACSVRRAPAST